jgi:hypothetical protein
MTHRPTILSAKTDKQMRIVCDADRLKAMRKADRPANASMNEIRDAYADAMEQLADSGGSVAAVESVELPSERLEDSG